MLHTFLVYPKNSFITEIKSFWPWLRSPLTFFTAQPEALNSNKNNIRSTFLVDYNLNFSSITNE